MGSSFLNAHLGNASRVMRVVARPSVHRLRALPVWRAAKSLDSEVGPLVILLPSAGKEGGAALLRIYNMADALRPLGWRTLVLPPQLSLLQRRQFMTALKPDILVMQGVRHPLNRPQLYPHAPIVFDMDDADFHLSHLSKPVRRAMPHVARVIAGSDYVARWCAQAGAGGTDVVWTGTPVSSAVRPAHSARGPVIAWAQTRPMTYTVEAAFVRTVTRALAAQHRRHHPGSDLTLRLYDRQAKDDPGFADSFKVPGLRVEWVKPAPYKDYLASFDDVALGLAPLSPETPFSRGKSFGKVLAYLDRMVPVLASDACEHGRFFTLSTGVVSNEVDDWVGAGLKLLKDPQARQNMAEAAFWEFQQQLSVEAAAERVDSVLRQTLLDQRGQLMVRNIT